MKEAQRNPAMMQDVMKDLQDPETMEKVQEMMQVLVSELGHRVELVELVPALTWAHGQCSSLDLSTCTYPWLGYMHMRAFRGLVLESCVGIPRAHVGWQSMRSPPCAQPTAQPPNCTLEPRVDT